MQNLKVERIACNLCGADDSEICLRKGGLEIARCRQCGLVYANPRLVQDEIWKRYSEEYFWREYMPAHGAAQGRFAADWHRGRSMPVLTRLKPYRQLGSLLEVGCAAGFFLRVAKDEGWEVHGVEIMTSAVQYARTMLGLDVFEGMLEQARFGDAMFDVVVMIETIEHLLDPASVLRETYRILRPGGAVWVATPNLDSVMLSWLGADWSVLSPAEHLFYFTEATLAHILKQTGFRTVDFIWYLDGQTLWETLNPFNSHQPTRWRSRLVKGGVVLLGRLMQPLVVKSKRTDRLIAVAVK